MPSIEEAAKAWQLELSGRVGRAVQEFRKRRGWSAVELAKVTRNYGYPISRVAISKIESNSRSGKVDLAELFVLAAALGIPPLLLIFPDYPYGRSRILPDYVMVDFVAARWLRGSQPLDFVEMATGDEISGTAIDLMSTVDEQENMHSVMIFGASAMQKLAGSGGPVDDLEVRAHKAMVERATEQNELMEHKVARLWEQLHKRDRPGQANSDNDA